MADTQTATQVADLQPTGKAALFRKRERQTKVVQMPDGSTQTVVALKPKELAEINERCIEEIPDPTPKNPNQTKRHLNTVMRNFYMIARALLDTDGKKMFRSQSLPDNAWIAGAEQIAVELDNAEVDALLLAVLQVSGLTEDAQEQAGKGSGRTRPA